MNISLIHIGVVILHLIGSSSAFVVTVARPTPDSKLSVGTDNDDFLDALSPQDDKDSGQYKKYDPSDEGEANEGGTRFQQMMQAAQDAEPRPPPLPDLPNPPSQPEPLAAQSMENMSVDEQAAMFRAMMQGQQPPSTSSPPPTMRGGVDAKGRKIGRNRDADTIANTSDLYFAQLKRDSSVRTMARLEGDDDTAEKVFEDKVVKEYSLPRNPHLEREREQEKKEFESLTNAMLEGMADRKEKGDIVEKTGPSYKRMLDMRRKKKDSTQTAPPAPAPVPEPVQLVEPQKTSAISDPSPQPIEMAEVVPAKQDFVSNEAEKAPQSLVKDIDDTRSQLRTLMGMFLKHRGGQGFGSGLLRGKEVDDFETHLKQVGSQLRQEAGPRQAVSEAHIPVTTPAPEPPTPSAPEIRTPVAAISEKIPASPPPVQSVAASVSPAVTVPPPSTRETAVTTVKTNAFNNAGVEASLACVEGAIQMYKNSPPELADGMLMALRATLQNALNKCSQVIDGDLDQTISMEPTTRPIHEAVVEGKGEQVEVDTRLEVAKPRAAESVTANTDGLDSNSVLLQKVYNALDSASGDGKLGLGPISSKEASELSNMVGEMRNVLMEELDTGIPEDSPNVLMEELDTGIPEDSPNVLTEELDTGTPEDLPIAATTIPAENTISKYQQMLAKAREKKNQ